MKIAMQDPEIALIFDMDGVIIDSNPTHTVAWTEYLYSQGIHPVDIESRMVGRHNSEIVRDFFAGRDLTNALVEEHGAKKEALYRSMIRPALMDKLVPGILEFLERYADLPLAVA